MDPGPTGKPLPEITEAKRLTLRPGDSLVIRLNRHPDQWEAHEIAARVREVTGVPAVILGPDADIEIIAAPGVDGEFMKALAKQVRRMGGDPHMFSRKAH